jgi:phage-related protein
MATFTYVPSYSSAVEYTPRLIEAKFGDGYEQAVENGINSNPAKWSLTFSNVSDTTAEAIISFFTAYRTYVLPFDWTDPNGVAGRYKCKSWQKTFSGYEDRTVTCTFEQVYW